jgi:parallel beta-helix repeat protein
MSGWTIVNNTFIDCQKGIFVGGGRKNVILNNYFENVDTALHLDDRGDSWENEACRPGGDDYVAAASYIQLPAWAPYNITVRCALAIPRGRESRAFLTCLCGGGAAGPPVRPRVEPV